MLTPGGLLRNSQDTWEATLNTDLPSDPITGAPADPIVVKVTRDLAPLGADRFHALINAGFFNDSVWAARRLG